MRMKLIQVKVDEQEHEKIRSYAKDRHEATSTYVRKAALSFPEYGKTPISYETQHDRENKAKVRQAVEDKEPYEVKIEPGTIQKDYEIVEQPESFKETAAPTEDEIRAKAKALVIEKGIRYQVAYAQVVQEAAE